MKYARLPGAAESKPASTWSGRSGQFGGVKSGRDNDWGWARGLGADHGVVEHGKWPFGKAAHVDAPGVHMFGRRPRQAAVLPRWFPSRRYLPALPPRHVSGLQLAPLPNMPSHIPENVKNQRRGRPPGQHPKRTRSVSSLCRGAAVIWTRLEGVSAGILVLKSRTTAASPNPPASPTVIMSCSFIRSRGPAPTDRPRGAVGRRKGRRGARARKKVAGRSCRRFPRVASEEAAVAEKLRALKELIPCSNWSDGVGAAAGPKENPAAEADRLFEDAAGYILLLRTRVGLLQKLVELYCSGEEMITSVS